ncbi:MAG: hypothetical protein ACREMQ_16305 [Longimicrobiales bacterium]
MESDTYTEKIIVETTIDLTMRVDTFSATGLRGPGGGGCGTGYSGLTDVGYGTGGDTIQVFSRALPSVLTAGRRLLWVLQR